MFLRHNVLCLYWRMVCKEGEEEIEVVGKMVESAEAMEDETRIYKERNFF